MEKKLYYRLEADDYNVIMNLDDCFEWIRTSCGDIEREKLVDTEEADMPIFVINPVWMTEEQFNNLPEAD